MADPIDGIRQGLSDMDVPCSLDQAERLLAYLLMLKKWNRVFNLTAVDRLEESINRHVLDSASVLRLVRGARVLDVGTGAGLPGIPLAILDPDRCYVLLDSSAKKIRFIQQVVISLGLKNVQPVAARIEQFDPAEGFDSITSRAFSSLELFVGAANRLLSPQGSLLALKGRLPVEEMGRVTIDGLRVHKILVPGLGLERHIIEIPKGA
jgi:16S rRNA (guanine527-N7)-methyltransferase